MNNVILIGRITKDLEVKEAGTAKVVNFTLAVDRGIKDKQGNKQTDFINCQAWNATATYMGTYLKKGNLVALEGRIQTRSYQDQQGQTRYVTEVVADQVNNLTPRSADAGSVNETEAPAEAPADAEVTDDDLPF
jgi:single-strand DNA-binding protein